jgi:hypothetical protein
MAPMVVAIGHPHLHHLNQNGTYGAMYWQCGGLGLYLQPMTNNCAL